MIMEYSLSWNSMDTNGSGMMRPGYPCFIENHWKKLNRNGSLGTILWQTFQSKKTPQGWLLFDGWNYVQEGLVPVHLWQWKELLPAYRFPEDQRPDHCYVDFVAYCWEHEGMQGFGFGTPHGHLALEFGDDLGNFYCVGMYMDPRSKINTKVAPGAIVRACLMSPDPYMPSHGEKTLHRYFLGKGEEGRENVRRLKEHIESIQDWKIDEVTKRVATCNKRTYHMFDSNCGVFCDDIEKFTVKELGARLMALDDTVVVVPLRSRVQKEAEPAGWIEKTYTRIWNIGLLFVVDLIIYFAMNMPWLSSKIGVGRVDHGDAPIPEETLASVQNGKKDPLLKVPMLKHLTKMVKKPRRVLFPRRIRLDQLYSSRLRDYTAKFTTS
eukprot:TRINITY_DN5958_c0_g1_i2.p1 TRINITY_DN5958_c0_g1~~TRINITY_DN5958_c0_g1_i2.p1  ORF type:complete len:380 (+),score=94.14 TRINITY_DN5958_c0_g1_i2:200-1339(+)